MHSLNHLWNNSPGCIKPTMLTFLGSRFQVCISVSDSGKFINGINWPWSSFGPWHGFSFKPAPIPIFSQPKMGIDCRTILANHPRACLFFDETGIPQLMFLLFLAGSYYILETKAVGKLKRNVWPCYRCLRRPFRGARFWKSGQTGFIGVAEIMTKAYQFIFPCSTQPIYATQVG